jgi:ATP-dependent RNA helicase SUPV3L1/SUV3
VLLPSEARAEASAARVEAIVETTFEGFVLDAAGQILLEGSAVGRLARGSSRLTPEVEVMDPTVEGKGGRTRVYRRLLAWSRDLVDALLDPLRRPEAEGLSPDAKGLVYVLEQHLGVVSRTEVAQQGRRLTEGDRRRLARMDVRLGAHFVYVASMLKPDAVTSRAALLRAEAGNTKALPVPRRGAASVPVDPEVPTDWYAAVGYPPLGPRAVRVDQLERALAHLRQAARSGPFPPPEALLSWLGCSRADLDGILLAAGFQRRGEQWVDPAARHRRGRRRGPRRSRSK